MVDVGGRPNSWRCCTAQKWGPLNQLHGQTGLGEIIIKMGKNIFFGACGSRQTAQHSAPVQAAERNSPDLNYGD